MDLNELRLQIDDIDSQILALFLRRMEATRDRSSSLTFDSSA